MVKALEIRRLVSWVNWQKGLRGIGLVALIAGTGCNPTGNEHPDSSKAQQLFRQASKLRQTGNSAAAITSFERAATLNPDWAEPHLELGLLYEEKSGDPISAIYHYRRYIKMSPDSPRRPLVEDFIERSLLSLATTHSQQTTFSDSRDTKRVVAENALLSKENERLQIRVRELEQKAVTAAAVTRFNTTVSNNQVMPAQTDPVRDSYHAPENVSMRTYMVQKGDTLQSLALRFYGSRSGWENIYRVNRAILPGKDTLKIGQVLIIP